MIFNMMYGTSVTPPPPETWDFEVYDHAFTESTLDDIQTNINPFSSDNINRNWEMIINASTAQTTENGSTIGVIYYTGDENTRYCVELGIRPSGIYLYRRGNLEGLHDRVFPCNPIDQDIRVVKTNNAIGIYCGEVLINAFLMTTNTPTTANTILIGRWYGGSGTYHFIGYLNYFKFRFTS